MRWFTPLIGMVLLLSITVGPSAADDSPWEKFSFNAGLFAALADTNVQFGSDLGVSVNLEDLLGMDTENQVFRLNSYWRFSDNRKHRLDIAWFSFNRSASTKMTDDIIIDLPDDDPIFIESGTVVESFMDLDIFELGYRYSFIQDDRLDFSGGIGLYIMPISFGFSATGLVEEEGDQKFTAPLPVLNLKLDVLLAPKWYFRSGSQLFYIEYEGITGSLTDVRTAVEYNPWKHVGLGLGVDAMRMNLEGNGKLLFPKNDLKGTVEFNYIGLFLYGRVFF